MGIAENCYDCLIARFLKEFYGARAPHVMQEEYTVDVGLPLHTTRMCPGWMSDVVELTDTEAGERAVTAEQARAMLRDHGWKL